MADDSDDELLMEILRDAQRASDPVPPHVADMAKLVPEIAQMDSELAELVEPVGSTRASEEMLVFQVAGATITVEVSGPGLAVDVIGMDVSEVSLEWADRSEVPLAASADGWSGRHSRAGSARIVVVGGGRRVATSWFTLAAPAT